MPTKTTTGRTTKPRQTTTGTKAKTTTSKAKDKPIKDKVIDIKKNAKPETVNLFDKLEIEKQPGELVKVNKAGNPAMINPINATPSELSIKMAKLKVIYDWDKINLDSDDEVEERISDYFNYCIAEALRPTVEGLAMALGIDRRTLWTWETGSYRAKLDNTRLDIIKKAKDYIAFLMSDMVMDNKINAITWIFYAKNYFGMKDTQDLVITPNNALQPTMSMEEIAEKVKTDVVIDTDYSE
jgi:DNA-binding XRE family transcriptional regulator